MTPGVGPKNKLSQIVCKVLEPSDYGATRCPFVWSHFFPRYWRSLWLCWFFLLGNGSSCPCPMGPMGPMGSMIIPQRSPGAEWKMKHRLLPNIAFSAASGPAWVRWAKPKCDANSLRDFPPWAEKIQSICSQPRTSPTLEPAGSIFSTTNWVVFSSLGIFPELHATKMLPFSPSPRSGVFSLHCQQKLPVWVDFFGSWVAGPIATSMWSPKRIYPICAKHWWQGLKKLPCETRARD